MRHIGIGELAERTGTSRRLLRYYEEQGLITSGRAGNGYRRYDGRVVERVLQIRGLLAAGLPTRIITLILPCLDQPGILHCATEASPQVLDALEDERDRLSERIALLTRNRQALVEYLDAAHQTREPGRPQVDTTS